MKLWGMGRGGVAPAGRWARVVLWLSAGSMAFAQPAPPRIGYVYPAGGRQGTEFHAVVGGQGLDGVSHAGITGGGIEAEVIEFTKPMPLAQFNRLRDELQELRRKRAAAGSGNRRGEASRDQAWMPEDGKRAAELLDRLFQNPPNRHATPALAERVTVRIRIAPDAAPGDREIRLRTANGLSNPLVFRVGRLPERSRPAAEAPNPEIDRLRQRLGQAPSAPAEAEGPPRIELPVTLNGQIMPGGVNRYRFEARAGERLVFASAARQLIPYLADAVPGWFQGTLALFDADGIEVGFAERYQFHPDPVLFFEVPRTGEYFLEIRDSIYRGREDFVYRLTAGSLPFPTAVFPLGGGAGEKIPVEVSGWNLSQRRSAFDARGSRPGPREFPLADRGSIFVPLAFAVGDLPEVKEREPNDTAAEPQPLTLPVVVNGRIGRPGDLDVFSFQGRAGQTIMAEVQARRLGSPLDSFLRLTDHEDRPLAFNDDHEDPGSGLLTHHADSYLTMELPEDGTYFVHLGDAQGNGGPEFAYRLRLGEPRPDFELRVVPSSIVCRVGLSAPLTVHVLRRDGFDEEILLSLKDADGFALHGGRIPPGLESVRVTLTPPPQARDEPYRVRLEGRALVDGRELVRPAVPAEDRMQAFLYRHIVPVHELQVALTAGRFAPRAPARVPEEILRLPAGGRAVLHVTAPLPGMAERFEFELCDPPEGIEIAEVLPTSRGADIVLRAGAGLRERDRAGNLVINLHVGRTAVRSDGPARQTPGRIQVGSLPAIPYEVVH